MSHNNSLEPVPKTVANAFEKEVNREWGGGVNLAELLGRVNRVASKLKKDAGTHDSRVSATFQERSFRHYQTLGCIDFGEREGRRVRYGCRHFTQALLVRRLLLGKVSAERIKLFMEGRSTEEMKRVFFGGLELSLAEPPEIPEKLEVEKSGPGVWKRFHIAPGVEVHLYDDFPSLTKARIRKLLVQIEKEFGRYC